jgi:hypothetical protein
MATHDELTVTLTPRERLHLISVSDLQHAAQHGDDAWIRDAIRGFQVARLTCDELHALHEKLNPEAVEHDLDELVPVEFRTGAAADRERLN